MITRLKLKSYLSNRGLEHRIVESRTTGSLDGGQAIVRRRAVSGRRGGVRRSVAVVDRGLRSCRIDGIQHRGQAKQGDALRIDAARERRGSR